MNSASLYYHQGKLNEASSSTSWSYTKHLDVGKEHLEGNRVEAEEVLKDLLSSGVSSGIS